MTGPLFGKKEIGPHLPPDFRVSCYLGLVAAELIKPFVHVATSDYVKTIPRRARKRIYWGQVKGKGQAGLLT